MSILESCVLQHKQSSYHQPSPKEAPQSTTDDDTVRLIMGRADSTIQTPFAVINGHNRYLVTTDNEKSPCLGDLVA
ncbi:hypothetical protein CEXT_789671 [Caerostris extrusa]|uniref:Uncharacterized protein n=1 Tax=Caerostris extrusa TaxID=172846 RepID=A0AAV4SZ23_CAEEX|nr:hypothetical protein CEXT_789671 [Caerostris extrusa]